VRPDQLYRLGRALGAWAGEGRSPSLEALAVSADLGPRIAAALLTKLEEAGLVEREMDEVKVVVSPDAIEEQARGLAGQFQTLRTQDARRLDALGEYARTEGCRASFLSAYFGEEDGEPCGLCDNCQERKPRSAGFFAPIRAPEPEKKKRRSAGSRRGRSKRPRGSASGSETSVKPRRRRRRRRRTTSSGKSTPTT